MFEDNNPESVYYYIASTNGEQALSLLTGKYGYSINGAVSDDEIASKLYEIVQQDGQSALVDVMELHPDKTMILELFATPVCSSNNMPTPPPTVPPVPMPQLPICNKNDDTQHKPFLNDPKNVMIAGVAVIALIAIFRPRA